MAPSTRKLEQALREGTEVVFAAEPDSTTVNKVRKHVEQKLNLDEGFFSTTDWKLRSKALIKGYVEKLAEGWTPSPKKEPEPNTRLKRQSSEPESPQPKRRKRASKPKQLKEESDFSDLDEGDFKSEEKARTAPGRKRKAKEREESPTIKSSPSSTLTEPRKVEDEVEVRTNAPKLEADGDNVDVKVKKNNQSDDKIFVKHQADSNDADTKWSPESEDTKSTSKAEDTKWFPGHESKPDEEDEYSDVIDIPTPKRKKKEKGAPLSKSAKPNKPVVKTSGSSDDPDEAEIKKLQSQLLKCGVRKLWHNELKSYGTDSRAKIRHLKKMLADVGMEGRFSEAKAREIKETRELLADAEAAQEMNALWGLESSTRASRSKAKSMKVENSDESGGEAVKSNDVESEQDGNTFAARRRAHADLAFLGDDTDDSD